MNRKAFWGWVSFWTGFGLLDFWRTEQHDGSALTQVVRAILRWTRHPKAVCASCLAALGGVLYLHFTKDV